MSFCSKKKEFGFSQIFFFRFQKDLTEKGVRLRSTYLLMFLFCCVYFFFVILDALLQQCPQGGCNCWNPLVLFAWILDDLIVATFKLFPFWALSSLPLVLVALLHSISLLFRRKDIFKNRGWVSYFSLGIIGVPTAMTCLLVGSIFVAGTLWLVLGLSGICFIHGSVDYI